jgi:AcrR family transcriptional regulator
MAIRKYEQRLRAEAAEETRRRILDAVYQRLRAAPLKPASVDQIARAARVSRSTVYLIFGSRAGLFDAVIEDLMQRAGFDRITAAVAHPDAREHLRQGIRAGAEVYAVDRDVHRILFSMATVDPEVAAGAMQRMEERRFAGMTYLAGRLAEQDLLRPDLSEADAATILYVMTSFEAFDLIFTGRGLPADEAGRLLAAMAERAVCR